MITSKTNKKIRVGIRAAVQKSNLDRGGENMKKKEQKKVLIQKGMTVGMIFFLLRMIPLHSLISIRVIQVRKNFSFFNVSSFSYALRSNGLQGATSGIKKQVV